MRPVAIAFANILLEHHGRVCSPGAALGPCLITYTQLCILAKLPNHVRATDTYLREIAEWCQGRELPPINALVVSAKRKKPGASYEAAPGCTTANWQSEARRAIDCEDYPDTAP